MVESAVTQAITLLQKRDAEIDGELRQLHAEQQDIRRALTNLGVTTPSTAATPAPEPAAQRAKRNARKDASPDRVPVRTIVLEALESRKAALTNAELAHAVLQVRSDLNGDRLQKNVRSAVWALRQAGLIDIQGDAKIATKWLQDADRASDVAEALSEVPAPTREEGGGGDGQGDDHDLPGRNDHRNHRAALVEARNH